MTGYLTLAERDDGIVIVAMADPSGRMNRTTGQFKSELEALMDRWAAVPPKGVILLSDRPDFGVGGDVDEIARLAADGAAAACADSARIKAVFRRIETAGFPVVAVLAGLAVGGSLELALACHARFAVDAPATRMGLPETTIGLIPGAGGLVRSLHMLGFDAALDLVLSGRLIGAAEAEALGWIDGRGPDRAVLIERAAAFIAANPAPRKPWDRRGYALPGGAFYASPARYIGLQSRVAAERARAGGRERAAITAMECLVHASACGFADGERIESRGFARQACSAEATARIGLALKDKSVLRRAPSRPKGIASAAPPRRVGIIGAGIMGAGIAFANARAGVDVLLADVSPEAAEAGLARVRADCERAVKRGHMNSAERDTLLARVRAVAGIEALQDCDLLIEAVFEDIDLKTQTMQVLERQVAPGGMIASNTSALSIADIGAGLERPDRFIGLHFFSPVDRMHLVEIVRGQATSDATLAAAHDYANLLGKMPIVVRDSHGFFASRVFQKFIYEAAAMVGEGIPPAEIEAGALLAGYPAPPLSLIDDTSLSLSVRVIEGAAAAARARGVAPENHPGERVIQALVAKGREGRRNGRGFYDHGPEGKALWPGLAEAFPPVPAPAPESIGERFLLAQVADVLRCLAEGVIASEAEVNSGAIRAIGFPAWTGGPLRLIGRLGEEGYLARASALAAAHGARFDPGMDGAALARLLAAARDFDAAPTT